MKAYLFTVLFSVFSFCAYAQKESLTIKIIHPKKEIKYGLMTSAGKELVPARYEYANRVFEGHYLIGLEGKYAVADSLLNPISDFYNDYDIIDKGFPAHYFARAILDEQKRATFLNQAEVMAEKYKSFGNLKGGLVRVKSKQLDLYGIIDSLGNEITPPQYGYLEFEGDFILIHNPDKSKRGLIDTAGKEILPCIYDKISQKGIVYAASKEGKYETINKKGQVIAPLTADTYVSVSVIHQTGVIVASINGKYGIVDMSGNILTPFEYDNTINFSSDDKLIPITKEGKVAFFNQEGRLVTPLIYDEGHTIGNPIGGIGTRDGKKYYLDSLGHEVLSSKNSLWIFNDDPVNGTYIEETDLSSFFNYYNTKGEPIKIIHRLPYSLYRVAVYEFTGQSSENALVGFLDGNNKLVIPYQYSYYRPRYYNDIFEDGKCLVRKKNLFGIETTGIIDRYGKELIPFLYQDGDIFPFLDICTLSKNNKIAFANVNNGKLLTPFKYTFVDTNYFKNGYFIVENKEEKKGVVNIAGKEILPCEYDGITAVSDAQNNPKFFILRKDEKSGLADGKTGEITIPCQYSSFFPLRNNTEYIRVSKKIGDKFYKGLLESSTGKEILPFIYDDISWFGDKAVLVKKDDLYGIMDLTGKEMAPCEYKEIITQKGYILDNLLIFGK